MQNVANSHSVWPDTCCILRLIKAPVVEFSHHTINLLKEQLWGSLRWNLRTVKFLMGWAVLQEISVEMGHFLFLFVTLYILFVIMCCWQSMLNTLMGKRQNWQRHTVWKKHRIAAGEHWSLFSDWNMPVSTYRTEMVQFFSFYYWHLCFSYCDIS